MIYTPHDQTGNDSGEHKDANESGVSGWRFPLS
ncbi:hypothetical protein EMIT0111MI5_10833 [Burkholderia sp. IT-111MI5]